MDKIKTVYLEYTVYTVYTTMYCKSCKENIKTLWKGRYFMASNFSRLRNITTKE